MKLKKLSLVVASALPLAAATTAHAAVPDYVTTAIGAAVTSFGEHLGAIASPYLNAVIAVAALIFIGMMVRKFFRG